MPRFLLFRSSSARIQWSDLRGSNTIAKGDTYGAPRTVEGSEWIYRRPIVIGKHWRCRRRHRVTGAIECITLEAQNGTAAAKEVQKLAEKEREAAKEAEKTGTPAEPQETTMELAVAGFAKTLDVRPATMKSYSANLEMCAMLIGKDRRVSTIKLADIEKLFTEDWKGFAASHGSPPIPSRAPGCGAA